MYIHAHIQIHTHAYTHTKHTHTHTAEAKQQEPQRPVLPVSVGAPEPCTQLPPTNQDGGSGRQSIPLDHLLDIAHAAEVQNQAAAPPPSVCVAEGVNILGCLPPLTPPCNPVGPPAPPVLHQPIAQHANEGGICPPSRGPPPSLPVSCSDLPPVLDSIAPTPSHQIHLLQQQQQHQLALMSILGGGGGGAHMHGALFPHLAYPNRAPTPSQVGLRRAVHFYHTYQKAGGEGLLGVPVLRRVCM